MAIIDLSERDTRNAEFFGAPGQLRLFSTRAVIVGVGGLGSALAQHLALLGVMHITVADDEELDDSNRNRFIGATVDDPVPGSLKVEIAVRLIRSIDRRITAVPLGHQLLSPEVFQAVRECDWVFGCFDEDGPRAILNELAVAYDKTYVDIASDVPEPGVFGGHVITVTAENGCLACLNVLDQRDVRRFLSTDEELADENRIYGIKRAALLGRGPSVSPMNGVVASLAASEFMVAVTGMRPPARHIEYRGQVPAVRVRSDRPREDCPVCALRAKGAIAEVERYLALEHVLKRRAKKVGGKDVTN
jgi:molybdopterin/thiamine biosynthesis adenylyltransferase